MSSLYTFRLRGENEKADVILKLWFTALILNDIKSRLYHQNWSNKPQEFMDSVFRTEEEI